LRRMALVTSQDAQDRDRQRGNASRSTHHTLDPDRATEFRRRRGTKHAQRLARPERTTYRCRPQECLTGNIASAIEPPPGPSDIRDAIPPGSGRRRLGRQQGDGRLDTRTWGVGTAGTEADGWLTPAPSPVDDDDRDVVERDAEIGVRRKLTFLSTSPPQNCRKHSAAATRKTGMRYGLACV
jgi:hypothetical protein